MSICSRLKNKKLKHYISIYGKRCNSYFHIPATTLLSSAETITVWHLSLQIVFYAFLYTHIQWCAGKYLTTGPRKLQ